MLYYEAERICLHNRLMNDVVSGCSPQRWELTEAVSRPCVLSIQIASCLSAVLVGCCSLACVCVPFWELRSRPWQNTFLPFLVPVQDSPPPTKGEFCVRLCLCVRVLCLAKCLVARVFSGCFRACSASTACMLACVHVCTFVCVSVCTSSVVGHDSKEGFRTHGSELNRRPKGQIQLSTALLPLSFSLTVLSWSLFFLAFCLCPSRSYCSGFPCVCVFITAK